MTNPDREELVKLANNIEAYGFECEGGSLANCEPWLELKRRLASSDGGVQGDPEPVANKRPVAFRVRKHKGYDQFDVFADETDARIRADARGIDYDGLYLVADRYTAPPADAGMREALENVRGFLDTPVWRRRFAEAPFYGDVIASIRNALTSPGATTKSDGGLTPNATTIAAIEELERGGGEVGTGYGEYTPVTVRGSTSDPSSTRSDVTVDDLDQFEIRRKK